MFTARNITASGVRTAAISSRTFSTSRASFVRIGDKVPDLNVLAEGSPGNKVNLAEEIGAGKALIIGVPAAFSPGCSNSHIPGFMKSKNIDKAGKVFVVAVNDPFVTKAWGEALDPENKSGFRFIADPAGKFTKALHLDFDGTAIFGNERSKRYALLVEGGKVLQKFVEPDNTGIAESTAEKVLGA